MMRTGVRGITAAAVALLVWWPGVALAQQNPATTTTSPPSPTTTTPPPPPTVPPGVPLPPDGASELPPSEPVVVPPATRPPSINVRRVTRVVTQQLLDAQNAARAAEEARVAAEERVGGLQTKRERLVTKVALLERDESRAVRRLADARDVMDDRVADAYIRGPLTQVSRVIESKDPNDFLRRMQMVRTVLDADNEAVDEYRAARRNVSESLRDMAVEVGQVEDQLTTARQDQVVTTAAAEEAVRNVTMLEAGSAIAVGGFVFPVGDPHNFIDSFGAARMTGTTYAHSHQGTDIFAPSGTPLYACERGVITRLGNDVLGGIKVWLVGASGHRYYYAHLSSFVDGLQEGQVVEAGDVIGFVGNTGNARTTPAHLHFEIHPAGGPGAANPFPVLKVVDDATIAARGGLR